MTISTTPGLRIKLAEAMGWKRGETGDRLWFKGTRCCFESGLPNPFTDANDCEALILWLSDTHSLAIDIIRMPKPTDLELGNRAFWFVKARRPDLQGSSYDDYKIGVCELALKVLEDNPVASAESL